MASISLKALVDKGSNKVMFIDESDDFVDVLNGFLTLPIGKIIKLDCQRSLSLDFHGIHNLYRSVEELNKGPKYSLKSFLDPCCSVASHLMNLKLKIEDVLGTDHSFGHFSCSRNCNLSHKVFGLFVDIRSIRRIHRGYAWNSSCQCAGTLQKVDSEKSDGGVFIKELAGLIITDDLHVMPPSVGVSSPLFTKFGVDMVGNDNTAQMTFEVGLPEVMNLIMRSFVSKSPLTDTLLKKCPVTNLSIDDFNQAKWKNSQSADEQNKEDKISVKLTISKSKKMVCYAEAGQDFANLLFSFLMVPFGYIVKRIHDGFLEGCIDQLWKSVQDLDDQYWKSKEYKELVLTPKLDTDIDFKNDISAHFMITDTLIIRHASPTYAVSILNSFKVPFTDFEEKTVHVGKDEVFRLLVASFLCDSVLTNAFIGPL